MIMSFFMRFIQYSSYSLEHRYQQTEDEEDCDKQIHCRLAICSPNFIQVEKGRDWKTVFFLQGTRQIRAEGKTFFCPVISQLPGSWV